MWLALIGIAPTIDPPTIISERVFNFLQIKVILTFLDKIKLFCKLVLSLDYVNITFELILAP